MTGLKERLSFSQSFWILSTTQIAKYVPGRIWYMVGRVYVGKKQRMDSRNLTVSMFLESGLLILSSSVIFLISTVIIGNYNLRYLLITLILLIIVVIVMQPGILMKILNVFLKIMKKETVALSLSYLQILKVVIYFFGLWIAQIIGFFFLINAIYPLPLSGLPNLAAAYTLSWITGFIVLFAPGGLGVREGMMTLMLSPILPTPLAIAISFITRVWITLFEVAIFFVGLAIRKRQQPS